MVGELRSTYRWPRVREVGDGWFHLSGRYRGVVRSIALRGVCRAAVLSVGLGALAAAFLPAWAGRRWNEPAWLTALLRIAVPLRGITRELLVERWPAAGRALLYPVPGEIDWHLAAAGLIVCWLSRRVCGPMALLATAALWPVLSQRLRVTIGPTRVVVHGRLLDLSVPRDGTAEGPVAFRVQRLREVYPAAANYLRVNAIDLWKIMQGDPAYVVLSHGLRSRRVALLWSAERAEQYVVACQHAMNGTRPPALKLVA